MRRAANVMLWVVTLLAAIVIVILASASTPTLAHAPDAVVVEYYHAGLDHYFVTASAADTQCSVACTLRPSGALPPRVAAS